MRLKYAFETMELDDQIVAVPVGDGSEEFRGVVKLNEEAAFVFNLLKEEISEESIVNAMAETYDAPRDTLAADVHKCVADFMEKGLLS